MGARAPRQPAPAASGRAARNQARTEPGESPFNEMRTYLGVQRGKKRQSAWIWTAAVDERDGSRYKAYSDSAALRRRDIRALVPLSPVIPAFSPPFPPSPPVIPAKAGIQKPTKTANLNQPPSAAGGSPIPSWAYRGRLTEIKRESQPTDPFPLYGGRLGWGCRGR